MTDIKKTLQEMKEFDKHFDMYEASISKEIVDIKLSLNRDLIKEIWNTALEAAAQMALVDGRKAFDLCWR